MKTLSLLCLVSLFGASAALGADAGGTPLTLRVTLAGTGTGTVTSPTGVVCASSCVAKFPRGAKVTLSAVADSGSTFAGWSGGRCTGAGDCTFELSADNLEVIATFNTSGGSSGGRSADRTGPSPSSFTLTVKTVLQSRAVGAVTSMPAGIDCGNDCEETFPAGTAVTLHAAASAGQFLGWSGACTDTSERCTLTLNANTTVTANFGVSGLTIMTSSALPDAQVGVGYSVPLTTAGGSGRAFYQVVSGSLPPGLRLVRTQGGGAALITGRPTRPGTRRFTLRVRDSSGTSTQSFRLTVEPASR